MNRLAPLSGQVPPLFRSKWSLPAPLARPFRRERLHQRLQASWERKLTVLAAPTGYGKTSLLRMWTAEQSHPVGWLRLDASDNELRRFLLYFIRACPLPPGGEGADAYAEWLRNAEPDRLAADLEAFAAQWIGELERNEAPFMIVLDSFEAIRHPDILRFLTLFLRFGPLQMHLVLAGRAVPGIAHPRQEEGGTALIPAEELALTDAELAAYVHSQCAARLSRPELAELAARAQGWFVGANAYLPLVREHRRIGGDPACHSRAEQDTAAYFRSLLTDAEQPLLARTLGRLAAADGPIDDALANALTADIDAAPTPAGLARQGWFLFPLPDDLGRWAFHPMFASYLRRELRAAEPQVYTALQRINAEHAEREDRYIRAAEYALAGGERELAADLLLRYTHEVLREGRMIPLLERFTEDELQARPALLFLYAHSLIYARRIHAAEHAVERLAAILADAPNTVLPSTGEPLAGYCSALRSMIHFSRGETEAGLAYMEQTARELKGPGRLHRHSLYFHPYTASLLRGKLAHYGVLRSALATFEYCLPRWGLRDTSYAVIRIGLGECLYEQGRLEPAEEHLRQGLALGLDLNDPGLFVPAYLAWAQLKWRQGEKEAAWTALREARSQLVRRELGARLPVVDACEVKLRIREQDARRVRAWLRVSPLAEASSIPGDRMYEAFALLRAYLFLGKLAEALALAEKLLHFALETNHPRDLIEVHLLGALICRRQGNVERALDKLDKALSHALAQGYVQMIADEGAALAELLKQYRKSSRAKENTALAKFADSLLKTVPKDEWPDSGPDPAISAALTRQEKRVFQLLVAGASNRAIADSLSISVETVKKHCRHLYRKLGVVNRKQAVRQM